LTGEARLHSLRCELCDIICTENHTYPAHIRRTKYQKIVKLHTELGKSIQNTDPTVLNPKPTAAAKTATTKKPTVTVTSKTSFVTSGNLGTSCQ